MTEALISLMRIYIDGPGTTSSKQYHSLMAEAERVAYRVFYKGGESYQLEQSPHKTSKAHRITLMPDQAERPEIYPQVGRTRSFQ